MNFRPRPEDWFDSLLETTADLSVILADTGGVILQWLGASERLFGFNRDEVVGGSLSALFTTEDVAQGLDAHEIAVALATGKSEDDRWHMRKDGSRFWGSGVLTSIPATGDRPALLCKVVRDRTDTRSLIETLQNQVAGREAEIEQRKALFATTVHEMRNSLNPMVMAAELIGRSDVEPGPAIKVLKAQLNVLSNLVRDLSSDIDNSASAKQQLQLERTGLGAAVAEAAESFVREAEEAGIELRLLLPSAEIWIRADKSRFYQMLANLIGNGLKYTPRGGHVNVSASIEGDMGVVRVEDDGVGMSPSILPHVFELFTREGGDPAVKGFGVGLAVVNWLAKLHGGTVEARSAGKGAGSSFALRIPLWTGAEPS